MKTWEQTYASGEQMNNVKFPEQSVIKIFHDKKFQAVFDLNHHSPILDLGCGFGRNIPLLQNFFKSIYCLDPSKAAVEYVTEKWGVSAKQQTPPKIPFKNAFGTILAFNSIYYLDATFSFEEYLQNITKSMKKGGLLITSFIGPDHDILRNSIRMKPQNYILKNTADPKFRDRCEQLIFVPEKKVVFADFGLNCILSGEIKEDWDGKIRHLKIYCLQKK